MSWTVHCGQCGLSVSWDPPHSHQHSGPPPVGRRSQSATAVHSRLHIVSPADTTTRELPSVVAVVVHWDTESSDLESLSHAPSRIVRADRPMTHLRTGLGGRRRMPHLPGIAEAEARPEHGGGREAALSRLAEAEEACGERVHYVSGQ